MLRSLQSFLHGNQHSVVTCGWTLSTPLSLISAWFFFRVPVEVRFVFARFKEMRPIIDESLPFESCPLVHFQPFFAAQLAGWGSKTFAQLGVACLAKGLSS